MRPPSASPAVPQMRAPLAPGRRSVAPGARARLRDSAFALTLPLALARCDGWRTSDDVEDTPRPPVGSRHTDADGDGWTPTDGDCDDGDPKRHPEATEVVADGIDQDCDGREACSTDGDEDGWGARTDPWGGEAVIASDDLDCSDPGEAASSTDCDDADPSIHPGATEIVADGIDQDCDGGDACQADGDGDGHGSSAAVPSDDLDCLDPGEATTVSDCDDGDPDVHPDSVDRCGDGIDQDCDGTSFEPPACEDCSNGAEDDGDGLVDCEDGDCGDVEPCLEVDCDDGADGDADGLTDCADDDCWGPTCHPAGVRARVHSGTFRETLAAYGTWFEAGGSGDSHRRWERHLLARSVRGTVQVLPAGAPSWASSAARTTCDWSLATARVEASFEGGHDWDVYGGGMSVYAVDIPPPIRGDLHVASGCRLRETSWFLPERIVIGCEGIGQVLYDHGSYWSCGQLRPSFVGPIWYGGPLGPGTGARTSQTSTFLTTRWGRPGTRGFHSSIWAWSGAIGPASVYTALP